MHKYNSKNHYNKRVRQNIWNYIWKHCIAVWREKTNSVIFALMLLPSAIESIAGTHLRYSIKCLYWTHTWNINNFENKLLVWKLPKNHMITKTKVTVSDYFMLVVFQFNCNLGLKEYSKINIYVNLFYIMYLLYGKILFVYGKLLKKNVF